MTDNLLHDPPTLRVLTPEAQAAIENARAQGLRQQVPTVPIERIATERDNAFVTVLLELKTKRDEIEVAIKALEAMR